MNSISEADGDHRGVNALGSLDGEEESLIATSTSIATPFSSVEKDSEEVSSSSSRSSNSSSEEK